MRQRLWPVQQDERDRVAGLTNSKGLFEPRGWLGNPVRVIVSSLGLRLLSIRNSVNTSALVLEVHL
jgi:hypothetical protein